MIVLVNLIFPQQRKMFNEIKKLYQSFEYQAVVNLSNELLKNADSLDAKEIEEIYVMKAVSHYALAEESAARISFINILKLNEKAQLDSDKVSPKILALFNEAREEYFQSITNTKEKSQIAEKTDNLSNEMLLKMKSDLIYGMIENIFLPGLGQLSNEKEIKGWSILFLSSLALSSSIYFIFDTNSKEKTYLSQIDPILIKDSYTSYNNSYKLRNISLIAYGLIWLYSQLDYFIFDSNSKGFLLSMENNDIYKTRIFLTYKIKL